MKGQRWLRFRLWLELRRPTAEKFWIWLSWKMPRPLVKWCAYRVGAHATTGKYGDTIVPDLSMTDMFKRWDTPNTLLSIYIPPSTPLIHNRVILDGQVIAEGTTRTKG